MPVAPARRTKRTARALWVVLAGALVLGLVLGLPTTTARTAWLAPFDEYSAQNLPLGTGAVYESATDTRTADFLDGKPAVNSTNWSVTIGKATMADPEVIIRDTRNGDEHIWRCPVELSPTGGYDRHVVLVQPDGVTAAELYAFTRTDIYVGGRQVITTSNYAVTNLLGNGLQGGAQASSISLMHGVIRAHELAALDIPHSIRLGIPADMLKHDPDSSDGTLSGTVGSSHYLRQVWPARRSDNRDNHDYDGPIAMGSAFGIPPSVDLSTLDLSPEGLALGEALQNYPAFILIQGRTVNLSVEPTADPAAITRLEDDWTTKLYPHMRRISNYANGLTLDPTNTPTDWSLVGGGGERRRALAGPVAATGAR